MVCVAVRLYTSTADARCGTAAERADPRGLPLRLAKEKAYRYGVLADLSDADLGGGVGDEGPRERGHGLQKFRDGERALSAFLLGDRQEVAARG